MVMSNKEIKSRVTKEDKAGKGRRNKPAKYTPNKKRKTAYESSSEERTIQFKTEQIKTKHDTRE